MCFRISDLGLCVRQRDLGGDPSRPPQLPRDHHGPTDRTVAICAVRSCRCLFSGLLPLDSWKLGLSTRENGLGQHDRVQWGLQASADPGAEVASVAVTSHTVSWLWCPLSWLLDPFSR